MKYANYVFLVLFVFLFSGCGEKYPLPPENPGSLPSEEDYIPLRNTSWDYQIFSDIRDIIVGKDGYVYVLEREALLKFNTGGDLVDTFYSGFANVRCVAQDRARNLYIGDSSKIYVFNRDKVILYTIDFADSVNPCGIDLSNLRYLYISDSAKHLVVCTDSIGNHIETIATQGSGILSVKEPHGVFLDEKFSRILIASSGNNWVEGLSITAPRISMVHLGGLTHEGGDTAGVFAYPIDVWADSFGCIYVLDFGNKRVQKFDSEGRFIHMEEFNEFPVSVATSRDGMYMYVAFSDKVLKMKKPELPQNPGGKK
ncbi:MAG TPA: NHL repeat-containing protein [Candidatus Hydrothermia bacterium]|nr:NHL repeat-containing protein [Candidatus Hydrothermae bacterium]MDD3649357.1 NHL repeat-containing protein [Candidatus Hydrothermia bacterium]MDD5573422.1 NHL repeat-containing protein [Candidatus Hydrothermia bacterium]HOK22772.1 NHL repeat-containing protein [Candidatus Hydrothermia bacterium]HOL23481.1 NHL repeat-containing protein [Candidatus Hydrothermia bacterium]